MLKRRSIDLQINHERWLVSYADFVTLLFAFFVVMYSVSHINEQKYQELSSTLNEVFSERVENKPIEDQTSQQKDSANNVGNSIMALPALADEFYDQLSALIDEGAIEVTNNELWLHISLNNRILFDTGSVQPTSQAKEVVANIATILGSTTNPISVEGFTDNLAINTAQFPSNWQLSAARAAAIVQLLTANGVAPEQLSAIGYGEFRPIADNASEAGRAKNRRVTLVIGKFNQERPTSESSMANVSTHTDKPDEDKDLLDSTNTNQTVDAEIDAVPSPDKSTDGNSVFSTSLQEAIEPIILDNGELLFTADPKVSEP